MFWAYTISGKGFGRVRIEPVTNLTVDVFVTHTHSDSYYHQNHQIQQLKESVLNSNADVVILGGDLNVPPSGKLYEKLVPHFTDSGWSWPSIATYGNPRNYFSRSESAQVLDYIFYKVMRRDLIAEVKSFEVPFFTTTLRKQCGWKCNSMGLIPNCVQVCHPYTIPLSDHEPIMATLQIKYLDSEK